MAAPESSLGPKLRLNVSAASASGLEVGRFLVLVDHGVYVSDLEAKIRGVLAKGGVPGRLVQLTNDHSANLPSDELVGDVLRDQEDHG